MAEPSTSGFFVAPEILQGSSNAPPTGAAGHHKSAARKTTALLPLRRGALRHEQVRRAPGVGVFQSDAPCRIWCAMSKTANLGPGNTRKTPAFWRHWTWSRLSLSAGPDRLVHARATGNCFMARGQFHGREVQASSAPTSPKGAQRPLTFKGQRSASWSTRPGVFTAWSGEILSKTKRHLRADGRQ